MEPTFQGSLYTEDARRDQSCKIVLANKVFLSRILKRCVEEYKDCTYEEIAGFIEGEPEISSAPLRPASLINGMESEDHSDADAVKFDIKFSAAIPGSKSGIGLIINLEAQNKYHNGYPLTKRGMYYCSRLISSQYGREFEKSHYERLKKVYSIWLCLNAPKERRNTITEYGMTERNIVGRVVEERENYDLIKIVMVCLGRADENGDVPDCDDEMLAFLDVLFANELRTVRKKQILEDRFGIEMSRKAEEEVDRMCNFSDGFYERGLEKGIEQGMATGIAKGLEQGMATGMAKGLEQGMATGIAKGSTEGILFSDISKLKTLMKKLNTSFDSAADLLDIPAADRSEYREIIARELAEKKDQ